MAKSPQSTTEKPATETGSAKDRKLIETLRENWHNEIVIAKTYRKLAEMETDLHRASLLTRMAESEEHQAILWQERLAQLGADVDPKDDEKEIAKQERFAKWFGVTAAIRRIEQEERGHVVHYTEQTEQVGDARSSEILASIIPEEEAHANRLKAMAATDPQSPRSALDAMLAREHWHRVHTGGWLGDAIYGANDGLGAVFGTVSTVAGATVAGGTGGGHAVLLAGIAVTLASALSMGGGAYLATKAEAEVHEAEISRERYEIEQDPEHEREELELMYQLKGFTEDEAKTLAARLTQNPEQFLQTMAAEELGLSMQRPPNPFLAATSGTISTALGGFVPLLPFFFTSGMPAIISAGIISLIAHFAIGAAKTFVTGRSWLASGTEMTVVGMVIAVVTYVIGLSLGSQHLI